ncbi:hypothetical protein RHDC4_00860 [Rhodocyclaceae bacterium]|nr:hypothetical protein RHDC4_00860 [Rhodocyclaceae bacterium]
MTTTTTPGADRGGDSTPLVTAAAVAQACESIKNEGKKPSVRSVRARLGGGSPNDIAPLLADWKKGVRVVEAPPIQIDSAIYEAIAAQVRRESELAQRDAAETIAALESDVEELTQAGRSAELRGDNLNRQLESTKGQLQSLAGQIDQLKTDAEQIKADAAAAVAKAEEEATRERKDREATISALGEAHARLEALPRLEEEVKRLHAELAAERSLRADAERQVAAANATAKGLTDRLTDTQEQLRQAQTQTKEARTALEQTSTDAKNTAARIGVLDGTVTALEKQLAAATTTQAATQAKLETTQEELARARAGLPPPR